MSICGLVFIDCESNDNLGASFNVSNMLYIKISRDCGNYDNYLLSVFFSSSAPPLFDYSVKKSVLRTMLSDIVIKDKISFLKLDSEDGTILIPTSSILYTRDIVDDSKTVTGIILSNSSVIKSKKKINKDSMDGVIVDHLSIEKII